MTVTNRAVRRQPLVSVHSLDARRIWQRCHCAPRRGPRRAWKPSPPTTLTRVACSIKEATRLTRSETWSLFAAMQMRMPGAARAALATMMKQACDQALLNTPRRDLCRKKLRRTLPTPLLPTPHEMGMPAPSFYGHTPAPSNLNLQSAFSSQLGLSMMGGESVMGSQIGMPAPKVNPSSNPSDGELVDTIK